MVFHGLFYPHFSWNVNGCWLLPKKNGYFPGLLIHSIQRIQSRPWPTVWAAPGHPWYTSDLARVKKRGQPAENSSLEARIHNCGRLEQPLLWKNIMAHMSNVDSQASDSMQNWKNPPEQSHLSKELKAYPNMSNPNGSAGMIKVYDDVNLGFINHQVV